MSHAEIAGDAVKDRRTAHGVRRTEKDKGQKPAGDAEKDEKTAHGLRRTARIKTKGKSPKILTQSSQSTQRKIGARHTDKDKEQKSEDSHAERAVE